MHLYKRGNVYWIEFIKDGKRYRKSTGTTKLAEARSWMNALKAAAQAPTLDKAIEVLRILYKEPEKIGLELGAAWETYSKLAAAVGKLNVAPKTLKDRQHKLAAFIAWTRETTPTVETVQAVSGAIAAAYAQHLAKKGVTTKTRRNTIGELSTVWTMLTKISPDIVNPWTNLSPADTDRQRIPSFTLEEERDVLEAARRVGKDWFAVCTIARHSGLRYGDIARLTWAEVDERSGVIRRKPSKTERFGISVEIPIIAPVAAALSELDRNRGDYLFPLHAELYGKRGKEIQAILSFREVLDEAGVSGRFTFHSWRHTAATRLSEAGVDVETRKRILGHTTDYNAERYDHAGHVAENKAALEAAAK